MGRILVIGLCGAFVIGVLAVGTLVVGVIVRGGILFASEDRSFGELSLVEQIIAAGVVPAIVILAGVLPWWIGGFSWTQSLVISIAVHAVTIGIGLVAQEPILLIVGLILGWIVLPVAMSRD